MDFLCWMAAVCVCGAASSMAAAQQQLNPTGIAPRLHHPPPVCCSMLPQQQQHHPLTWQMAAYSASCAALVSMHCSVGQPSPIFSAARHLAKRAPTAAYSWQAACRPSSPRVLVSPGQPSSGTSPSSTCGGGGGGNVNSREGFILACRMNL